MRKIYLHKRFDSFFVKDTWIEILFNLVQIE